MRSEEGKKWGGGRKREKRGEGMGKGEGGKVNDLEGWGSGGVFYIIIYYRMGRGVVGR